MDYEKGKTSPTDWLGRDTTIAAWIDLTALNGDYSLNENRPIQDLVRKLPLLIHIIQPEKTVRHQSKRRTVIIFTAVDLRHGECHHSEIKLCALMGREQNP
jgi:hypothetical protein